VSDQRLWQGGNFRILAMVLLDSVGPLNSAFSGLASRIAPTPSTVLRITHHVLP
jgi:hypothetical protein